MKHNIILTKTGKSANGTIQLTGSKSECNRALVIEALSDGKVKVENISDAADAVLLAGILRKHVGEAKVVVGSDEVDEVLSINPSADKSEIEHPKSEINIGPAGTAMRFLTAYYAIGNEEVILTGSERMKQRPIGILVDALRELGAEIDYEEQEGYPPIKLKGSFAQRTRKISIKGNISSQYITALLLIAAKLPFGLELHIEGELTSRPYVEMTLAMLKEANILHTWEGNVISVENQQFATTSLHVEPDWSAASYWYAIAALSDEAELFLPGLTSYSLQGDSVITEIMANFGITSQFKETDRILALQTELAKIGVKLIEKGQVYKLDCSEKQLPQRMFISTYHDHRMAMAFAPLAILIPELEIEDADVVEKSYPAFWKDLEKVGFNASPPAP
jgi:3-phosphoshikimate 1-carboxyvinyltransferase